MHLRSIKTAKGLKGKRVLVRADFNVPVLKGKIGETEDWRIRKTIPTIEFLMKAGARVILASHMGRPTKKDAKLKLDPVAKRLAQLLCHDLTKLNDSVGPKVAKAVGEMEDGDVLLLENLRFNKGEEADDPKFAAQLADLAEIYVNDSFATCHRKAASLHAITDLLPSYAGLLLINEVEALERTMQRPARPYLTLMGGAKVSTKIGVIEKLLQVSDRVLLGGALVIPFFVAKGHDVGASSYTGEDLDNAKKILASPHARKLILPHDVLVGSQKRLAERPQVVSLWEGPTKLADAKHAILDIGPKTVSAYASYIRSAQTIVWNGPLGWFEVPKYSHATLALGRLIATRSKGKAFGLVGGGESVQALQMTGLMDLVDHVSTGGGAMLEFLEGRKLPGIEALNANAYGK